MTAPINRGNGNHVIDLRRRLVAQIIVRKPDVTQLEVQQAVAEKMINERTGKPYSEGIIRRDILAIRERWRQDASLSFEDMVAEQRARLHDLYIEARNPGTVGRPRKVNLRIALDVVREMNKIIGAYAPEKTDITSGGKPLRTVEDWLAVAEANQEQIEGLEDE